MIGERLEAWGDLWQLYFQIATPTARKRLIRQGFCEADAEDVVMESALSLCEDSFRRLRSFRGDSQFELCVWFRRVVQNHACNWLVRSGRANANLHIEAFESEDAFTSPSHADAELFLRDLADCVEIVGFRLSSQDVHHLRILAGLDPIPHGLSERTLRHWKQKLLLRLEPLV